MKLDPEGKKYIYVFLVIAVFCAMTQSIVGYVFCGVSVFLSIFSIYFFRDPDRKPPDDINAILSPADGLVATASEYQHPTLGKCNRIGIFMNIFDVHVNRSPIDAKVTGLEYKEGTFKHAGTEGAFENNEQMIIDLEGDGINIQVIQIAGMVARRVICRLEKGQGVKRAERIGLIRFGSRLEVFLPFDKTIISVKKGDRVVCGESSIARKI
ncbi:phosphatidylserine decarboxylase family protein [bacterium]|nr:phosphatidylserine decarboxylase family protein [bacterium]